MSDSTVPLASIVDPAIFVALCNLNADDRMPANLLRIALVQVLDGRVKNEGGKLCREL